MIKIRFCVIIFSLKEGIMNKLTENILEFMNKNNLTAEECASKLGLTVDQIKLVEDKQNLELSKDEESRINKLLGKSTSKKVIRIMDLIFRFVAMVMALVTLLLCINENIDTKVLVVLISIGLVCNSMTILPKIDK